jgi:hypothetical protein
LILNPTIPKLFPIDISFSSSFQREFVFGQSANAFADLLRDILGVDFDVLRCCLGGGVSLVISSTAFA